METFLPPSPLWERPEGADPRPPLLHIMPQLTHGRMPQPHKGTRSTISPAHGGGGGPSRELGVSWVYFFMYMEFHSLSFLVLRPPVNLQNEPGSDADDILGSGWLRPK